VPVALGRAALSACVAAITVAEWLFIAGFTIVASLFGVAVGEGGTEPRVLFRGGAATVARQNLV
jgi:hypothetical protein